MLLTTAMFAGCKSEAPSEAVLTQWVNSQYMPRIGNYFVCADLEFTPASLTSAEKAQFGEQIIPYTFKGVLRTKKPGYFLVGSETNVLKYISAPAGYSVPIEGRIGARKNGSQWHITGYTPIIMPEVPTAEASRFGKAEPTIIGSAANAQDLAGFKNANR